MSRNYRHIVNGVNLVPNATTTISEPGDIDYSTDTGKFNFFGGGGSSPAVTEDGVQTLTNKTIDADLNTITNIDDGNIKTGAAINAAKIADGSVSSTEFQYLDGATSNIQAQINAISGSGITSLTGDVSAVGPGAAAATLATVNSNTGLFGSPTQVATFVVNAKGLMTSAANVAIALPFSQVTGTVPINQGGTGQTTQQTAINALTGSQVSGTYLRSNGTNATLSALQIGDFTGVLLPVNGGTGIANNNASTLTISGNFGTTLTVSALTAVTLPTSGTLSTLAGTETLTNKTFGDAVTGTQIATPSNPAAGKNKLYFKSDNSLYSLTSGGVETVFASSANIRSQIYVSNGNGFGSTNTVIRRFSVTTSSVGSDITYADSATNGASFTINTDGIYSITYSDGISAGQEFIGVTVNSAELTTPIQSLTTPARMIAFGETLTAGFCIVAATAILTAGDVVRPHDAGNANNTAYLSYFRITKISN